MPIPDLPGQLVPRHSDQELWLKAHVARMCHFDNPEKSAVLYLILVDTRGINLWALSF